MFETEWLLETAFGDEVRFSLGAPHSTPPDEDALWEIKGVFRELFVALAEDPWRRKGLEHLFVELTGRLPGNGEYSPFELSGQLYVSDLKRVLLAAAESGQLRVERIEPPVVTIRQELPAPIGPSAPAPTFSEPTTTWFEVRFVDEVGDPIDGLEVVIRGGGKEEKVTTNSDGVARLEGAESSFASVRIVSRPALADIVEPRFAEGRVPQLPGVPFVRMPLARELPTVSLESEEQKLIVVTPPFGKLFVELLDKKGRALHAHTEYSIQGPVSFEGATDASGRLLHEDVPPGAYELTLKVDVNRALKPASDEDAAARGYEPEIEEYTLPIPVRDASMGEPLKRWVGAVPRVAMARLRGMLFDTNKTFILPTAIPSLQKIRSIYEEWNPSELLIVGHTDASGEPNINDPLSQKRAESMQQYLQDDVDAWLDNYKDSVPQKQRWGAREDRLMLLKLPGYDHKPREQSPIEWYQRYHNAAVDAGIKDRPRLEVDGKSGPKTRRELIADYMSLDGATLGEETDLHISIHTHGCGENFPLDETVQELDARPEDQRNNERDRHDRRVELFFFDDEFGVRPEPTTPDGEEYLIWRRQAAAHEHDFAVEGVTSQATVIPVNHAHFRTGSAVMLPEGEAPVSGNQTGTGSSQSSVCALAMALRFNEERPGHRILIAGHTDSVGGEQGNQKLSEQRAQLVHAVLMGERNTFVDIAKETGKVEDWKQILKWASVVFASVEVPPNGSGGEGERGTGFSAADPGPIDSNASTGQAAVRAFQTAYNENYKLLGGSGTITVDGVVGKQTWGAIFDLYQFNMAQELGEVDDDADEIDASKLLEGLDKLRGLVNFLPLSNEWIGFGEAHPVDGNQQDNTASQTNRRVELLFFQEGQEPDLAILEEAPDITELYLPDAYRRTELPDRPGGARRHWCYELRVFQPAFEKNDLEVRVESSNLNYSRTQTVPAGAGGVVSVVFDNIPSGAVVTVAPKGAKNVGLIRKNFPVTRARRGIDDLQTSQPDWKFTPEPRLDFIGYSMMEDDDV